MEGELYFFLRFSALRLVTQPVGFAPAKEKDTMGSSYVTVHHLKTICFF